MRFLLLVTGWVTGGDGGGSPNLETIAKDVSNLRGRLLHVCQHRSGFLRGAQPGTLHLTLPRC